jgi:ribosomal silencing factor RsfS
LTCKNTLTKQIVILSENKSSQVGTINNNWNNNCKESERKTISHPNPDNDKNKCRLSKRQRKCLK